MNNEEVKEAFQRGQPVIYQGAEYIVNAVVYKKIRGTITVCARLVQIGKVCNSVIECRASDIDIKI